MIKVNSRLNKDIFTKISRVNLEDTLVYLSCENHNTPGTWTAKGGLAYKAESYLYTLGTS